MTTIHEGDNDMIDYINLTLSTDCDYNCWYCYLTKEARQSKSIFTDWSGLREFLLRIDLADTVNINFVTGEVTNHPDLIRKAVKEIRKLERVKAVRLTFSYITNGQNHSLTKSLIHDGIIDGLHTALSYDGDKLSSSGHNSIEAVQSIGSIVGSVNTALTIQSMENIESTLQLMLDSNITSWSYYLLLDYDSYSDSEFLELFRTKFLPAVIKAYEYGIDVYNIDQFRKSSQMNTKHLWCKDNNFIINVDGSISPCGVEMTHCRFNPNPLPSLSLSCTNEELVRYLNNHIQACHKQNTCDFTHCKASQCVECSGMAKIRKNKFQSCILRSIEFDFYSNHLR